MPERRNRIDPDALAHCRNNLVAFSGGPDSVCLLHLLLGQGRVERLRAVHVDHALDPQSGQRARQAQRIAGAMGVECTITRLDPDHQRRPGGVEAAARHARYECLRAMLGPGDHLLTAHHADDQLETVLLRLLRGAGPRGLAGMRSLRRLEPGWLGRPLLGWSRTEIVQYLQRYRLESIQDPTNADLSADRNYLRHRVLPLLAERWPGYRASVLQSARWQHLAADTLQAWAEQAFVSMTHYRGGARERLLDLEAWLALEAEQAFAVMRTWCEIEDIAPPPVNTVAEFRNQCAEAAADRQPALDWPEARVHAYRRRLWMDRKPLPPSDWTCEWPTGDRCPVPTGGELCWCGDEVRSAIGRHWRIAAPATGARLRLAPGRPKQQVRELMREAGVPPWRRAAYPALTIDGRLCAVGLEWMDCKFIERMKTLGGRLEWHRRPDALLP